MNHIITGTMKEQAWPTNNITQNQPQLAENDRVVLGPNKPSDQPKMFSQTIATEILFSVIAE